MSKKHGAKEKSMAKKKSSENDVSDDFVIVISIWLQFITIGKKQTNRRTNKREEKNQNFFEKI